MQLLDLFDLSLKGRRDQVALEYDHPDGGVASLTFGDLDRRSDGLAHLLASRGVETGDRIALFLGNRVEFIDLFLACVKLGAIVVPINVMYREREVAHIVLDAEPRAVIAGGVGAVEAFFPPGTTVWNVETLCGEAASLTGPPVRRPLDGDTAAAIVYTSGTTGRSKGAVLSHDNLLANAVNLVTCWEITSADRYLAVLPLFHVHGLGNGVVSWLVSGCHLRLVERFEASRAALLFETSAPTLFFGVPTIYVRLLELPEEAAAQVGRRMRLFVSGSAPLPAAVLESFRERFGHVILERYGMSETLMNAGNPYAGERRPGTVGLPFPGVRVRIVDPQGAPVPDETIGELQVRGPNVFRGYWRRPDADADAFTSSPSDGVGGDATGWFRTGDLARRSADGYLTLSGRRGDLIISGGFNIYPREVEEVLLEAPGVREAVVVGVPDARRGEVPVAYVVGDAAAEAGALEAWCRRHLASFKVPRAYVALETLPRTALGKVQRHLLPPWTPS